MTISEVLLDKVKKTAKSPGPFFLRLMDIMFSEETLADSSVYGKNGRKILNPDIMEAMKGNSTNLVMSS